MSGATLGRDDSRMLSGLHQSIGLVDRLVMPATGARHIEDVLWLPVR
jgi:elongation factor P--beta-lysine ligase